MLAVEAISDEIHPISDIFAGMGLIRIILRNASRRFRAYSRPNACPIYTGPYQHAFSHGDSNIYFYTHKHAAKKTHTNRFIFVRRR